MNTSKEQCVTWCAADVEWAEILLEKVLVPTVGGLGLLGNIVTIIVLNRSNPHNSKKSFYLLSFVIFSGQRWNPHFTRVWSPCLYLRLHSWYWWYLTTPWTSTHLRIYLAYIQHSSSSMDMDPADYYLLTPVRWLSIDSPDDIESC